MSVVVPIREPDAVAEWASRINTAWNQTVEDIITVGRLLIDAQQKLKDGAWGRLIGDNGQKSQLRFGCHTAYRLIAIYQDERILDNSLVLPPTWQTMYALTRLSVAEFKAGLEDGTINPEVTLEEVRSFRRRLRKEAEAEIIKRIQPNFAVHNYDIASINSEILTDASVDAIITDPPYGEKFLPTFSELAKLADRTLKPSGWCVVMTGAFFLPEVIRRLEESLAYRWQYVVTTPGGGHARLSSLPLFQAYKPVLLFQKPPINKIREWWSDVIVAQANEQDKSLHPWQQSETVFSTLVDRFSKPGDLIVDPFAGSGTTGRAAISIGRHFWGSDIDPNCAISSEKAA